MFEVIKQVLLSWQVIAVTVGLILFLQIVFYFARRYHRPISMPKIKIKKRIKAEKKAEVQEDDTIITNDNDDLGLQED